MMTMSSMFAERSKQQVIETRLTNTNYVEENVVSQQQPLTSRSSFVFGEMLLVIEGDVLSIYTKSMSKTLVSLTTIQWMMMVVDYSTGCDHQTAILTHHIDLCVCRKERFITRST